MQTLLKNAFLVGAGGFVGSAARYAVSAIMTGISFGGFPAGTFTVNIAGSFAIGLLLTSVRGEAWHLLLAAGLCGGFTTFSAFSAETMSLLKAGNYGTASGYITASIALCLLATWLGGFCALKFKIC